MIDGPLACWEKQLVTGDGDVFLCALPTGHDGRCQPEEKRNLATVSSMDLDEFLLARFVEDEAVAREAASVPWERLHLAWRVTDSGRFQRNSG